MIEETFLNLLEGDRTQLPENWRWSRLVDVCDVFMGQSPPSSTYNEEGQGLPFFQGKADFGEVYPSIRKWCAQPQRIAQSGDILMSVRAPVGPTNIANTDCCIGRGLSAIRPGNEISLWFLFRYLQHIGSQIADLGQGSTFTAISRKEVENLYVPVPPLDEQRRIVAKLESILAQLRTARAALHCIPPTLKALRQSVLAAAFRGELTGRDPNDEPASLLLERIRAERRQRWQESLRARGKDPAQAVYAEPSAPDTTHLPELPEGWVWSKIGMVFDVSLGGTPARDKSEYWNGQVPWVSSGEVAFCRISGTKETITNVGLSNSNAKYNPAGSVLLAMIGEGKTRGQAAILDIPATTNQNIAAINVTTTPIKPEWLFYWFRYQYEDVRDGGVGGAQPALNAGRIKELVFPIAPKEELERTIRKLGEVDRYIESIETIVQVASRRLDALEQSALAKAFRGELV